jgi:amidase
MGLQQIARCIASHEVSPVELTKYMLERIDRVDTTLKSYATVMAEQAMAAAQEAEREIQTGRYRGPLHGVPVAVKDVCCTAGVRTMAGTQVRRDFVPDVDATVVSRLYKAGAVLLGKHNQSEGPLVGCHPDFDVPRNPWDRGRWPGVSSSGSGVATAAGLCFAAIATDTGGSIRWPSAANGVVGLKPTYGRVSRLGVLPLSDSLDHVGPIARRVVDVAIVYDAVAGYDPKDPTSLPDPVVSALVAAGQGIAGVRLGIDREYALAGVDRGVALAIESALEVLAELGAHIVEVQMPNLAGTADAWAMVCAAEAVVAHAATYPSRASDYGPYFRESLQFAASVTPELLAAARKAQAEFSARFTAVLESVDALVCPGDAAPAWPITREIQVGPVAPYQVAWAAASPRASDFTFPMDLAGTPAICLPCGFSPEGLPYSIQFAGRRLSEPMLCRIAAAYEAATSWHSRHPDLDALSSSASAY